ncbi:MAG: hypothetical protein KJ044_11060, partial [Planctomycetes bacterium]|nr:hypothetical protein [Planctomycetota bacterium]
FGTVNSAAFNVGPPVTPPPPPPSGGDKKEDDGGCSTGADSGLWPVLAALAALAAVLRPRRRVL